MTPRKHQTEGAAWALDTIREYGLAYLAWEERTGKSLTALLTVENSKAKSCLIITKKKAIEGWEETLTKWSHKTQFTVINYESAHKVKTKHDFVILDEAHAKVSATGRPSKTWRTVALLTKKKPILYLSATPYSEHLGLIYHQLKLSSWSPFKDINFYNWFRKYGIPNMTRTPHGLKETYTKYKDDNILEVLKPLFNFKTRLEVGHTHEPQVNVIKIKPKAETLALAKQIDNGLLKVNDLTIVLDSPMKIRTTHYQLESSTIKEGDNLIILKGMEKIEYIKANYDLSKIVIMAHFIGERALLEKHLHSVKILSANAFAEGVDLSHYEKLIITSTDFSTSKWSQRLARQANHERGTEIIVDVLVMDKPLIGLAVVDAVAIKKVNFDNNSYKRKW